MKRILPMVLVMAYTLMCCARVDPIVPDLTIPRDQNDTTVIIVDDPPWLVDAKARIEEMRKADIEIRVVDAGGNPRGGAEVNVKMRRHAFEFGALVGERRFEGQPTQADANKNLEIVERYFNKIASVRTNDPVGDIILNWANARDIKVRGHYLMWARVQEGERHGQPEVMPEDTSELKEMAYKRIEDMITWAGDRVSEWNLVNHIVTDVSGHLGYDHLFGEDFFAEVFKFARQLAPPGVNLWVNEGNILPGNGSRINLYLKAIERLIKYGGAPDGIGFMAHFKRESDLTEMEEIYRRLDKFAELIPNLQLTELDIDLDDQQLHAEYLRDVMTIAFSHPAVSAITIWQLWGNAGDNINLWNTDWSIKPAGTAWIDLVHNQWWTDQNGVTAGDGKFSTRGFLGDFEVIVKVGNEIKTKHFTLGKEGLRLDFIF